MTDAAPSFSSQFPVLHGLMTTHVRKTILVAALLLGGASWFHYLFMIAESENLVTRFGPIVGGDFVAFWSSGRADGAALPAIYDFRTFCAHLEKLFPQHGAFGLAWQYPPTMFLVTQPLAAMPYFLAYWVWTGLFAGLYFLFIRGLWRDRLALLAAFAAPAAFQTIITGQTGFFTGLLVGLIALNADKRPLLAGLAAGLLTLKPQLGLLIPVAFIAAGAWRAIAMAAVTSLLLGALSFALHGPEPWLAFVEGLRDHAGRLGAAGFPFSKLTTIYGALVMIGAPTLFASAAQTAMLIGLAAFVFQVWRRTRDPELRLIALAASIPLSAPYVFYYELPVMLPALLLLAKRGAASGWLDYEKPMVGILWLLPLFMPGGETGFPIVFATTAAAFVLCARRVVVETGAFRFSSAGASPAQG